MHRTKPLMVISILLAALLFTVLPRAAGAEGAGPTTGHQVWLPAMERYPSKWVSPRVGMDITPTFPRDDSVLTSNVPDYWYMDWSVACTTTAEQDRHRVPILFGRADIAQLTTGTTLGPATVKTPCNDGRPLFVFNEANSCTSYSACIRAPEAVSLLEQVLKAGWHGPIYVGGLNMVGPSANNWTLAFLDEWQARHGTRVIPGIAGWHLHLYADHWANPYGGAAAITTATAPLIVHAAVWGQTDSLESFIQARRSEGNATGIVVTEHGWLQNSLDSYGGNTKEPEAAAILDAFTREFASVPEVGGWAWYADYVPRLSRNPALAPNYCSWCFDVGTLLEKDSLGRWVTSLAGQSWQNWARNLNTTP